MGSELQFAPMEPSKLPAYAYIYNCIQVSCECSRDGDAHATALTLFNSLSNYSWEAKVVLVIAAFALSYGEFWLIAQLSIINPLAKSILLVKKFSDIHEHAETSEPRFEALVSLVKAMLDVTKCIIEFKDLPEEYINSYTLARTLAMMHIPSAVYWIIRSAVACAAHIIGLIGRGQK
ncbi:hypothetical protein AMTR_s00166p00028130 [Amborella trichopoda]|uniref:Sieve element occlusion N-terminal domain-containing protein n=1 Tax=Amborella trichopoda TaxID=13333 RepID=W1PR20_AMBTC|nr:hypothetical protein AMTR_s00166p00028130 [Amborella trichopoda]